MLYKLILIKLKLDLKHKKMNGLNIGLQKIQTSQCGYHTNQCRLRSIHFFLYTTRLLKYIR